MRQILRLSIVGIQPTDLRKTCADAHARLMNALRMPHLVIVGAGFAGLNAAKTLANRPDITVTLVDRENHHVFQPLLYQVATAALSPAEIAAPIRGILSYARNVRVLMANVERIRLTDRLVETRTGPIEYAYLLLACGATHTYFGHDEWESQAPMPGNADVAMQEGIYTAQTILKDHQPVPRVPLRLRDWGHFATVGRGARLIVNRDWRQFKAHSDEQ
jgi:NADH dehydrogenase FAD-containing subunit